MPNLKNRIQEIIDAGYTQTELGDAAEVTKGTPNQWVSGGIKSMKYEYAKGIEKLTGYRAEWIITGKLPKKIKASPDKSGGSTDFDQNVSYTIANSRRIPVLSFAQAGALESLSDSYPLWQGFEMVFADDGYSEGAFAMRVEGLSMMPEFRPGDLIVIDPALSPDPGDYVAAKNGKNEATFKKYRPRGINKDGRSVFELMPVNPDFPIHSSENEQLSIIGVMVEHRKRFK